MATAIRRAVLRASRIGARSFSAEANVFVHPERLAPLGKFANLAHYTLDGMSKVTNQDKGAVIDAVSGRAITYRDFPFRVGAAAKGLRAAGIKKGDVVGIHCPNTPEYLVAFQAIASLGATSTTSNPLYTPGELAHQLRDSGASSIITIPQLLPAVTEAQKLAPGLKQVFVLGEASGSFLTSGDRVLPEFEPVDLQRDILVLPYSSGTTGLPKGVALSHSNIISNVEQCVHGSAIGISEIDVVLGVLPCYHIYGMTVVMATSLRQGATVVSMPKFDPQMFLTAIQKHRITFAPLVPPIIAFLAKHPIVSQFDTSSLRTIFSGAAPLDAETQAAAEKRLPQVAVRQGYGMTESSPVTHVCPANEPNVPGSIGRPVVGTDVKIVDVTTGAALPAGKAHTGEICIRGPQVMQRYHNNPTATASTLVDGWLHTGDIAYRDEEGRYFVVDRLKELIKVKGFQCAPAELEGHLLAHPAIMDAGVVGRPDERHGEVPVAFVVKKKTALAATQPALAAGVPDITEDEVKAFVAGRVAEYKKLDAVVFVDAIPKNPSGKILRRVLKEKLAGKA